MNTLTRLFGSSPAKVALVDTDDVYPLHMLDDTKTLQGIVVTWTLRFNDVLDADKLHAALAKLLEIGDWKKLGGRLRLNENGKLESHVPQPFTAERPAVQYSHEVLTVDIEDHPLAKTLPKATQDPSIHAGPEGFRLFAARAGAPETLQDFTSQDIPQLSLHITSFNDATLVSLSWAHVTMDVMGQKALLHGWALVLAGRESEVPPMLGAREDAICAAADATSEKKEEFALGKSQLKGWSMLMFGLRFAWDMLWTPPSDMRTLYLPKSAMEKLRRRAAADFASEDGGEGTPFVSDGDVLTAWAARVVAVTQPQPRPITVLHAVNARFRLSSLKQAAGVYTQNMAVGAFMFLPADAGTQALGHIALENRRHLAEQATEGQVLAVIRAIQQQNGDPNILCGPSDALLLPVTDWTKADIFKTADFGAAVVRAGEKESTRTNAPGTIVYHHAQSMRPSAAVKNVVIVLGKDHGGNYWVTSMMMPAAWDKVKEELESLR